PIVAAEGAALVLVPEQAPELELRYDVVDEVGQAAGQDRGHDVEAVGGSALEPFLDLVGDLLRCAGHDAVAAASGQAAEELPDREVVPPGQVDDELAAALRALGLQ